MNDREQLIRAVAAAATDLANSWARESGVEEARDELGLVRVIDGLWNNWSEKYFSIQRERDEMAAHVERLKKGISKFKQGIESWPPLTQNICHAVHIGDAIEAIRIPYEETPAASLAAHDAKVRASLMKPLIQMAIDRGWHDFPEDWQS